MNINEILRGDALPGLVQTANFVGWIYSIDYDTALIMTNDLWKSRARGVPHNSFLVATAFDPGRFAEAAESDREVLLLRVVRSARLPQDDDLVRTKVDHFRRLQSVFDNAPERQFDDLTLNEIQFGGLECRVLGTFYAQDGELWLGSDLESFAVSARLSVYRPRGGALGTIVNYVADPAKVRPRRSRGLRARVCD